MVLVTSIFLVGILLASPLFPRKFHFQISAFFILFIFLAFRKDFGTDYQSYQLIYKNIQNNIMPKEDLFFYYLNMYSSSFEWLIVLTSLLYICSLYLIITKKINYEYRWIALTLLLINPYLFLTHLSSLRQTIALSIFIIAMHFLSKNKYLVYYLLIFIAIGFHKSAILLLFVPLLKRINLQHRFKLLTTLLIVVIIFLSPTIDFFINSILNFFPSHYRFYLMSDGDYSLRSTILTSLILIILSFNVKKFNQQNLIFVYLPIIGLLFSIFSIKINMLSRVGMYFEFFIVIAIPIILSNCKNAYSKYSILLFILAIYIARYNSFFKNPIWSEHYKTYTTILNTYF